MDAVKNRLNDMSISELKAILDICGKRKNIMYESQKIANLYYQRYQIVEEILNEKIELIFEK